MTNEQESIKKQMSVTELISLVAEEALKGHGVQITGTFGYSTEVRETIIARTQEMLAEGYVIREASHSAFRYVFVHKRVPHSLLANIVSKLCVEKQVKVLFMNSDGAVLVIPSHYSRCNFDHLIDAHSWAVEKLGPDFVAVSALKDHLAIYMSVEPAFRTMFYVSDREGDLLTFEQKRVESDYFVSNSKLDSLREKADYLHCNVYGCSSH